MTLRLSQCVLISAALLAGGRPLAAAQDYCVTCTGPSASYVCAIQGMSAAAAAGIQGQVLCIKQLATEGRHEQCSIARNAAAVCQGLLKTVAPPAEERDAAAAPPPSPVAAPLPNPPADVAGEPPPAKPDTRNGLQKAGDSIGKAVTNSWTCVTSLFSKC